MPKVKHILDRKGTEVFSIGRRQSALEAAQLMNDKAIGSLVVVDEERVVGIVTERDILRRVVACESNPTRTPVEEVMSHPVACCRHDTPLAECRSVMTSKRIRHLPVVEKGTLCGMVTSGDILAHEISEHKSTIEYLNEYLYSSQAPTGV